LTAATFPRLSRDDGGQVTLLGGVDDLAAPVVKNRRWGARNPDAMFRAEVTAEQVLASRMVCDPLRLWMLCSPNEGAAAVLVRAD
jgi:acetyl-CoA acetyltransferase